MNAIEKRVSLLVNKLPRSFVDQVLNYWKDKNRILSSNKRLTSLSHSLPYWFILPRALFLHHKTTLNAIDKRFLNDIVWGQYCLYFAVRIQDDIFDAQMKNNGMLFVSDCFLFEADKVFRKHYDPHSSFWDIETRCMKETINGIIETRRLQSSPDGNLKPLLIQYANVGSVFKIGSAAVCDRLSVMNDYRIISKFSDKMSMASQIVDDIEDIREDLKLYRFNYAAKMLFGKSNTVFNRSRKPAALPEIKLKKDRIGQISAHVYHHLAHAERIISGLGIRSLITHVKYFRECYRKSESKLFKNF